MESLLDFLLSYVVVYKYLAIFIITFIGAFALPLPSGSVLMAASAFSVTGKFNLPLVIAVGFLGNLAGDNSAYWLVRRYGLRVLKKLHLQIFFKEERMQSVRRQLEKHPVITIFSSRFMTAIAPAVNVVCGLTEYPYKRYLLFESLGEMAEVLYFCILGYIFGTNWQYISQLSGQLWILLAVGLAITFGLWRFMLKQDN